MTDNVPQRQWIARPGLARTLRTVALLTPLTLAVTAAGILATYLPATRTTAGAIGQWVLLGGVSTVVLLVVDRFARRLLPLAALYRLALVFPDGAPSRYRLARSVATTRQLEAEIERAREVGIVGDRERAAEKVLQLVAALSVHDRATRGHAERVRIFTDMVAEEMDLDAHDVARLRWAALLHDVGKVFVPTKILNKPGKPTPEEWVILRNHPAEGARLAAPLADWLGPWMDTISQHHERWDGTGYPRGLSGRDIALGARIVAVADAFDVMTSARSYKRPMTPAAARADLARCAGSQFDPRVVRAFLALSLGRLRWTVGPAAWLLNLPLVRFVPLQSVAPASAAMPAGVANVAAVTSTAMVASGMGISLPALANVVDAAPGASASAEPFPDDSATDVGRGRSTLDQGPRDHTRGGLVGRASEDREALPPPSQIRSRPTNGPAAHEVGPGPGIGRGVGRPETPGERARSDAPGGGPAEAPGRPERPGERARSDATGGGPAEAPGRPERPGERARSDAPGGGPAEAPGRPGTPGERPDTPGGRGSGRADAPAADAPEAPGRPDEPGKGRPTSSGRPGTPGEQPPRGQEPPGLSTAILKSPLVAIEGPHLAG